MRKACYTFQTKLRRTILARHWVLLMHVYPDELYFCFAALLADRLVHKHLARSSYLRQNANVTSDYKNRR